jgi:hypothetical protein
MLTFQTTVKKKLISRAQVQVEKSVKAKNFQHGATQPKASNTPRICNHFGGRECRKS